VENAVDIKRAGSQSIDAPMQPIDGKPVDWLEQVTDEQYNGGATTR